jgi:hypothetical protein
LQFLKHLNEVITIEVCLTFIVAACDGPKSFLASRVPDLKLDTRSIDAESLESEVHSDGAEVHVAESVIAKTEQQGRFADCAISGDHHLE